MTGISVLLSVLDLSPIYLILFSTHLLIYSGAYLLVFFFFILHDSLLHGVLPRPLPHLKSSSPSPSSNFHSTSFLCRRLVDHVDQILDRQADHPHLKSLLNQRGLAPREIKQIPKKTLPPLPPG